MYVAGTATAPAGSEPAGSVTSASGGGNVASRSSSAASGSSGSYRHRSPLGPVGAKLAPRTTKTPPSWTLRYGGSSARPSTCAASTVGGVNGSRKTSRAADGPIGICQRATSLRLTCTVSICDAGPGGASQRTRVAVTKVAGTSCTGGAPRNAASSLVWNSHARRGVGATFSHVSVMFVGASTSANARSSNPGWKVGRCSSMTVGGRDGS